MKYLMLLLAVWLPVDLTAQITAAREHPGDVVIKKLVSGWPENLDIEFHVINRKRYFSDKATIKPLPGYEFWYAVNDWIYKQSTPLKNIEWPSDTPLGVWKAQGKIGLDTFNRWGPGGGWYDSEAGKPMNFNDSFPFASFVFEPANSGWDTNRDVAHWMDVLPDMKLPAGQVWVMPVGQLDNADQLIKKGVTHFSKFSLVGKPEYDKLQSEGRVYDEVPQTHHILGLEDRGAGASKWVPEGKNWPNVWNERFFGPFKEGQTEPMSYEDGYQAGLKFQVAWPVVVFENSEQDHALSSHWQVWKGFYDAYIPRLTQAWESKGVKPLVAHNYFTSFSADAQTLGSGSREKNKAFAKDMKLWPSSDLSPGGTLEKTTATCFGLYLNAPDLTAGVAYKLIFSAHINKMAGKELLTFSQSFHEHFPNILREWKLAGGKAYVAGKMDFNPAQAINYSFIAQLFTKGFIPFSAAGKTDEDFRISRFWHANDVNWLPDGATAFVSRDEFPYWGEQERFPGGRFEYYIALGVNKYTDTFAKVRDGESLFLRFQLDGGEWQEAANEAMDDLVDAYYDKRGFVYAQEKDGYLAVFYLNSFADNKLHTLKYEYKGEFHTMPVHSTIVHPVLSYIR